MIFRHFKNNKNIVVVFPELELFTLVLLMTRYFMTLAMFLNLLLIGLYTL